MDQEILKNPDNLNLDPKQKPVPRIQIGSDQLSLEKQPGFWGVAQATGNLRSKLHRREREIELQPFWKNFSGPIALISSAIIPLAMLLIGAVNLGNLPPKVPLLYDHAAELWLQYDKAVVLVLPILLLVLNAATLRISFEVHKFDRRLSSVSNWMILSINFITLVAVGQIYSLIL